MVLPSYHLQTLFYKQPITDEIAATEAMWNIAGGILGVENVNETYFQWQVARALNLSNKESK